MVRNCIKCGRFCSDSTYELDDKLCLDCLIPKLVEEWEEGLGNSEDAHYSRSNKIEEYMRQGISEEEARRMAEKEFNMYVKPVIGTYLLWLKRNLALGYDKDRAEREATESVLILLKMLSIALEDEVMKGLYHYLKNILSLGTRNPIRA